ncbi:MAG: DUF58 domain-containing protein [Anaerolineae bacterium]
MPNLLVFLLGVILLAAFFRFDFIFYIVYIFFFIYLLSRAWIDAALKRVVCERIYEPRALNGEKIPVTLKITNRSWLPLPYLRVHESSPAQLKTPNFEQAILSLGPRASATMHYELDCRSRGYYPLGPMIIEAGDLFGIYSEERQVIHKHNITVYPRIVALTELGLPAQTPFGTLRRKQSLMQDPSRLLGVRPYTAGDSMRHIHWKMTASSGQLQTKRFEPAISVEAQIFLNLNREDYTVQRLISASELAIITAASFANLLIQKRQTVGISSNGSDPLVGEDTIVNLQPNNGSAQLTEILSILARIQLNEQLPFTDTLRKAQLQLRWGGTAVVITPHAGEDLISVLLMFKRSGLNVFLVLVDPQASVSMMSQRMAKAGVETYQVWQEQDLNVWR